MSNPFGRTCTRAFCQEPATTNSAIVTYPLGMPCVIKHFLVCGAHAFTVRCFSEVAAAAAAKAAAKMTSPELIDQVAGEA